jgi:predicted Rossmann-fold nucleotide-binding protein
LRYHQRRRPWLDAGCERGRALNRAQGAKTLRGLRVELPFEQDVNPFVGQTYEHRTFFSRLHHFMIISDAFVVVPGGIGTLLELSLAWQLLQVRKLYNTPLILVGKMWAELVEWGRRSMLQKGNELASEIDFKIPHCVNTMDECIAIIRENRDAWLDAQKET